MFIKFLNYTLLKFSFHLQDLLKTFIPDLLSSALRASIVILNFSLIGTVTESFDYGLVFCM